MHQHQWSYHNSVSGAEPFVPHKFEPKQVAIGQNSIPKIFITPEAYADQLSIAQQSGGDEIGWLGSVRQIADYRFLIEKIFLIEQVVSGASTEMTEEGLADLFTDLAMVDSELCAKILFWGHIHPSNSTTSSSQDDDQMALFNHNEWFIRGIFGRSGRAEFTFFDYKRGIIWEDVPWQIYAPIYEDQQAAWKVEIEKKVSSVVVTYQKSKYAYPLDPASDDDSDDSFRLPHLKDRSPYSPRGNRRHRIRIKPGVLVPSEDFQDGQTSQFLASLTGIPELSGDDLYG